MTQAIKLTTDQMRSMSLFQNIAHVMAKDCIEDEKHDRIIFVVNNGKMGLAIGKGGCHIKSLQKILKKNVEIVEYKDEPAKFLKTMLNPKLISEVQLNTQDNDALGAIVIVEQGKKGLVVGREGRNATKARLLAKRYFGITSIQFNSPERNMEW